MTRLRLRLKSIQVSEGDVLLCVRPVSDPEILLKTGATFGGMPLSAEPHAHGRFVTASLSPGDFTLVLLNPRDRDHFTEGEIYTFEVLDADTR